MSGADVTPEQAMDAEGGPPAPTRVVPTNVPAALSTFIGRSRERSALHDALGVHRLLTVVGPGGAGKTRLAREVAASVAGTPRDPVAFADGVWWVELGPVSQGADVATTVAGVLQVSPSPGRTLVDALADALRPQRLLLVIDNCEHLIHEVAVLAEALLRAAPGLTMLCTSREALSVEGEVAWPIATLEHPSAGGATTAEAASAFDAVQLFVDRARAATPSFTLTDANAGAVASICLRLDGLPLALELAAAVVPVLGVEALEARLDDALTLLARGRRTALPRHRTLHAVLDWSYALLEGDERELLQRLSVFQGSFDLEALQAVGAWAHAPGDLIPVLGRLVEQSLVEAREESGAARYRLLETVRQFGRAKLRGTPGELDVSARHARWVAQVAERAEPALFSPARGRTVESLRQSVDEIRAALGWAQGPSGAPMVAVRIAGALGWFWFSGVPWDEARELLERTLSAADAEGVADADRPLDERIALARLFYPAVGLAYFHGDGDAILRLGTRALALWDGVAAEEGLTAEQRLAVARGRSLVLQLHGFAHAMRGDPVGAIRALDACIEVARDSGDPWLHAVLTMRRGLVHFILQDHAAARGDYERSVPMLRALGESWFLSLGLEGMAANALALGDAGEAARLARESITVLRDEPDAWFISRSLDTMAGVLLARRDGTGAGEAAALPLAARLLGAAEALRRRCGAVVIGHDRSRQHAMVQEARARLGEDAYAAAFASGAALTLADVLALMDDPLVVSAFAGGAAPTAHRVRRVALRALGPFALTREDEVEAASAAPAGKTRELLYFLLLHDRATKDEIGLALWPDASAAQVRNAFHVTLHQLRRQLGPEPWIVHEAGAYRLDRSPLRDLRLDADVDELLRVSATLRQAVRRREAVDPAMLERASEVLTHCRGDLAAGFGGGEWLVPHQDRVRAAWVDGVDALVHLLTSAGRLEEATEACAMLLAREPLRESTHRQLMDLLAMRGDPTRALAHYASLQSLLERELGARPSPETRALADRLRR